MSLPHPELNHDGPPGEPRRGFLTQILAAGIGLLVGAVPAVSGLAFFLDPLLRTKKGSGGDGFLKMPVALDALEINGEPQLVKVIMDKVDAWNTYLQQPVGAVFLRRTDKDKIVAFNSRLPTPWLCRRLQVRREALLLPLPHEHLCPGRHPTEQNPAARPRLPRR